MDCGDVHKVLPSVDVVSATGVKIKSCDIEESLKLLDYYKVLEVGYDATDEDLKLSYRRLALRWHPDKNNGNDSMTAKFQEISEAYKVLSDPDKRTEYDICSSFLIDRYSLTEYLSRFKGMILTCNGLGINNAQYGPDV